MEAPRTGISWPHFFGVVAGAIGIAFAPIFAKQSGRIGGVGMIDAAFWRVFFGTLALGPFLWVMSRTRLGTTKARLPAGALTPEPRPASAGGVESKNAAGWGWVWVPGVFFAGDLLFWHWSFEHTTAANSTLLANVSLIVVTVFAWWFWKERVTRRFVGGAVVAGGGVVLLLLSSQGRQLPEGGVPPFGDALALVTALFYAAYLLSMKRWRRHHDATKLMLLSSAVCSLCLLPVVLIGSDPLMPRDPAAWWPLIGLGVLSHAAGQGLIAYGLAGLPASFASVTLLVQPVCVAVLGAVLLGEELLPWQIAGGAGVLAGLFLAIRGQMGR